jgi:hypothetical protein
MGLQYEEDNSFSQRLQREIRNPSKRSVLVLVVLVLIVVSPFLSGWITNTKDGIGDAGHDTTQDSVVSVGELDAEALAPWLVGQAEIMQSATTPLNWQIGNFYIGNCSDESVENRAAGAFRDAIGGACDSLADIQGRYARDCHIAATCSVKDEAKTELTAVIDLLKSAHAGAGYTWPAS